VEKIKIGEINMATKSVENPTTSNPEFKTVVKPVKNAKSDGGKPVKPTDGKKVDAFFD
jgi:hypothetical protein